MRLWHIDILPYLPYLQFRGQFRELVAMLRNWKNGDSLGNLLVDVALDYPKSHLVTYFDEYCLEHYRRYEKHIDTKFINEFHKFSESIKTKIYSDWHNKEYLRVCMANLYEKYKFAVGKSKISEETWRKLLDGYKQITNENYKI